MTVLYGSAVADTTLTTACDMAAASGGVETSKQTRPTGTNVYAEVWSLGNATGPASVTAIPSTPTGNGWVYKPGAGTFAAGNWSATVTFYYAGNSSSTLTMRLFKYSGGSYTLIGTIPGTGTCNTKFAWNFSATSMSAITFSASDLLYIDLWGYNPVGQSGDVLQPYASTSTTAGVASDMQITTSSFAPAVVLTGTLAGASTLSGAVSFATSPQATCAGASTLSGAVVLATTVAGTLAGAGTLSGTMVVSTTITTTCAGVGTCAGAATYTTMLTVTCTGTGTLAGTVTLTMAFMVMLAGTGQLAGSLVIGGALIATIAGCGTLMVVALSFPGVSPTATWVTRDHRATWVTRDDETTWTTRR